MKQGVIWFFIIIVVAIAALGSVDWPDSSVQVVAVDYKAVVADEPDGRGKIIITEQLTFETFGTNENNNIWELWRALPEEYVDGVKVEYNVLSVKQIFEDGTYQIYTESPKLYWYDNDYINTAGGLGPGKWFHSEGPYNEDERRYECVLIYVDGLYRETVVYEIQYEMYNASLRYYDA